MSWASAMSRSACLWKAVTSSRPPGPTRCASHPLGRAARPAAPEHRVTRPRPRSPGRGVLGHAPGAVADHHRDPASPAAARLARACSARSARRSTDTTRRASRARMAAGKPSRCRPPEPTRCRSAPAPPPWRRSGWAGWSPARAGSGSAHPDTPARPPRAARTRPGGTARNPARTRRPDPLGTQHPDQVPGRPRLPGGGRCRHGVS